MNLTPCEYAESCPHQTVVDRIRMCTLQVRTGNRVCLPYYVVDTSNLLNVGTLCPIMKAYQHGKSDGRQEAFDKGILDYQDGYEDGQNEKAMDSFTVS